MRKNKNKKVRIEVNEKEQNGHICVYVSLCVCKYTIARE